MPHNNMLYEYFIRHAFNCERGGGPGGLAEASIFDSSYRNPANFNLAKVGILSSIAEHNNNYLNEKKVKDPDDYYKMENYIAQTLNAVDSNELVEIMQSYKIYVEYLEKLPPR